MSTAAAAVMEPEEPAIPPDLITVADAAKHAKRSIGFVYQHIREGHLRGYKAGRQTYVPRSEIDDLLRPKPLEFVPYKSQPRKPAQKASTEKKAPKKKGAKS